MILLEDKFLLNEDYYGKNKNLERCEELLENIRQKVLDSKSYNPSNSPENNKLCNILENEYGFKKVAVSWLYSGAPNAGTAPLSLTLSSYDEELDKTDSGMKINNSKSIVIIMMYCELFTVSDLSSDEALAILLHEIGHNFQHRARISSSAYYIESLNTLINTILITVSSMDIVNILHYMKYGSNVGRSAISSINRSKARFISSKISAFFTRMSINLFTLSNLFPIPKILAGIALLPLGGIKIIISWIKSKIIGVDTSYFGEKYSDSFVTSYGYAPQLSSALIKIDTKKFGFAKAINRSPFLKNYTDFIGLPLRFVNLLLDPHPSTVFRVKDQVKMLEYELSKSGLSKSAIKALENDLKETRKQLDIFEDKMKSESEFGKVGTIFNAFLLKSCGGDPKEAFFKTKSYDYDES